MPVAKEKRDYAKENARKKETQKRWALVLKNEEADLFVAILEKFNCKSPSEFARKISTGELIITEREMD